MSGELKPCPFCGGKAELSETVFYQKQYFVLCITDCRAHTEFFSSAKDAAQAWNSRPLEGVQNALIIPQAFRRHNDRPEIVCLCGSTRFVDDFNWWRQEFTRQGMIVLAIEIVTTQARHEDPQHVDPERKAMLDELHLCKIDLADWIFVLNVGGYIGESTEVEIAYAVYLGKPVFYLEKDDA